MNKSLNTPTTAEATTAEVITAEALAAEFQVSELEPRIENAWSSGRDGHDVEHEHPNCVE